MPGHWRFRRSIPLGGLFRLNINRRSVSLTAGRRRGGPHFTVSTNETVTASAGLPGSGLSYRWTTRLRKHAARGARVATHGTGKWVLAIVIECTIALAVIRWFM